MVDGNGLLHPRGFGLACHLGVLADLPTIGVGKKCSCIMWMALTNQKSEDGFCWKKTAITN